MGELTAEQIAQRAIDLNLLDDRQLQSVWGEFGSDNVSADAFVQFLLRRELLTNYQATKLLKGDRFGYFYGRYRVLYLVSAGTFARVYRAVDSKSGKVVAVKVLRKKHSDDKKKTDQFCREGEMGRTLRHANIVPIHEVHSQGLTHYLVMDFIEGGNLREFLKIRKRVEPAEATRLMIDVANGINYAHQRGVLHRDLKLTNVLVSSRGQGMLVDFGLAGADDRMGDDSIAGHENERTVDYAGLERATGVRKDDPRSDIYFLGCIYYHLLTGKAPLQETRDRIQRLSRTRYEGVVPIHRLEAEMPRVVSMVVNKAMELDAERRYQTPAQMLVDLNIAAKRLADGTDIPSAADEGSAANGDGDDVTEEERSRWAAMLLPQSQRRALMFIESNMRMQDIFRDGLKRCGYRVLLTSDPQRALARFEDDAKAADCVVFSSGDLGESAVDAFNSFGESEKTKEIPAVLILGENQKAWKSRAKRAQHRLVLAMPIKLRQLRSVLTELVPPMPE